MKVYISTSLYISLKERVLIVSSVQMLTCRRFLLYFVPTLTYSRLVNLYLITDTKSRELNRRKKVLFFTRTKVDRIRGCVDKVWYERTSEFVDEHDKPPRRVATHWAAWTRKTGLWGEKRRRDAASSLGLWARAFAGCVTAPAQLRLLRVRWVKSRQNRGAIHGSVITLDSWGVD